MESQPDDRPKLYGATCGPKGPGQRRLDAPHAHVPRRRVHSSATDTRLMPTLVATSPAACVWRAPPVALHIGGKAWCAGSSGRFSAIYRRRSWPWCLGEHHGWRSLNSPLGRMGPCCGAGLAVVVVRLP